MSGGEALLRPRLVRQLAELAAAAGTRSSLLSGLFFARSGGIPAPILAAIRSVDHFSASVDEFHEREVPRDRVFGVLDVVLAEGIDVSLHVVGRSPDDPYLVGLASEVKARFGGRVPMLTNIVSPFGRARAWLPEASGGALGGGAEPCTMAAWPVVGFDGVVAACGNDDVMDVMPEHLRLGDIRTDTWEVIRRRTLRASLLRAIRLFGPLHLSARFQDGAGGCSGYCATCMTLSDQPEVARRVEALMARASTQVLEAEVGRLLREAGAVSFAARNGMPGFGASVLLGAQP